MISCSQQLGKRPSTQTTHTMFDDPIQERAYLISNNFTSNISWELAGMPGMALLPYARWAGTVRRRSPPTDMPITPMSQPLITSLAPSLKVKGVPFLFAMKGQVSFKFKRVE